jgi:Kef-type K+ transport system membrane component KefB
VLNIISFLLIVLASLICEESTGIANQLLNTGVLLLSAYILSQASILLRLPAISGYIAAGIILGNEGFGFFSSAFTEDMTLVESIFFMLILSVIVQSSCRTLSKKDWFGSAGTGVLATVVTTGCSYAVLLLLPLTWRERVLYSLFAASFCPVMYSSLHQQDNQRKQNAFVLGAFAAVFVLWIIGASLASMLPVSRVRLMATPLAISLTSAIAGIVWGLVAEKSFYRPSNLARTIFPLAMLVIAYPLIRMGNLDTIFFASGIGIYNGLFGDRPLSPIESSLISPLIVFTLFGARLSIENCFMLGREGWLIAGVLLATVMITRSAISAIAGRLLADKTSSDDSPFFGLILFGPLSYLMVERFGPAFSGTGDSLTKSFNPQMVIISIMLVSTLIYFVFLLVKSHMPHRT